MRFKFTNTATLSNRVQVHQKAPSDQSKATKVIKTREDCNNNNNNKNKMKPKVIRRQQSTCWTAVECGLGRAAAAISNISNQRLTL